MKGLVAGSGDGQVFVALTNSRGFTMVDLVDYREVGFYKWGLVAGKYAGRWTNEGVVYLHRAICKAQPGQEVDHINDNKLDNRRANLRLCTRSQNEGHKRISRRNTSGYKGVSFNKREQKWVANICKDRHLYFLGYFKTANEAATAYDVAATKLFGEFAKPNYSLAQAE